MHRSRISSILVLAGVVGALSACGNTGAERAATGGVTGLAAGALVGGPVGAVVGGTVGAAGGAIMNEGIDQKVAEASSSSTTDTATANVTQPQQAQQQHIAQSSSGDATVREVQQALNQAGYSPGAVDGLMGPQTQKALLEFQQARNIEQSGRIDNPTLVALNVEPAYEGQSPAVIRDVQQALNDAGYDVGRVDGIQGPRTQTALRNFQQQRNLAATGEIDQPTLTALNVDTGAGNMVGTADESENFSAPQDNRVVPQEPEQPAGGAQIER